MSEFSTESDDQDPDYTVKWLGKGERTKLAKGKKQGRGGSTNKTKSDNPRNFRRENQTNEQDQPTERNNGKRKLASIGYKEKD